MSEQAQQAACDPITGRWRWNNEADDLEFLCVTEETKKKKKTAGVFKDTRRHLESSMHSERSPARGGRHGLQKLRTVGPAQLNAYRDTVQQSQTELVTIEHVKLVTISLMVEKDELPIPLCFMTIIKSCILDRFLATLLLYLSSLAERKALEQPPDVLSESIHLMESMRVRTEMEQADAKVELAKKHLAVCYSHLLLGSGPSQQSDAAGGRRKASNLFRDRKLFEFLHSFVCYVAWVTFGRDDLKAIQDVVGHLLSDDFSSALRTQGEEPENGEEQPEALTRQPESKKRQRRPDLNNILTKRSPLMVCLLPSPREKAPHLFQGSFPHKQQQREELSNMEELKEELRRQLDAFRFGILGQPLCQFDETTLIPLESKDRGAEGDVENRFKEHENETSDLRALVKGSTMGRISKTETSDKYSSYSRGHTVISRTTTEAPSSDTE